MRIISGLLTLIENESGIIGYLFPILQYPDGTILTDTAYFPVAVKEISMRMFSITYKDKIIMQRLNGTSETRWVSVPREGVKYRQIIDHKELPLYIGINDRIDTFIAERLKQ